MGGARVVAKALSYLVEMIVNYVEYIYPSAVNRIYLATSPFTSATRLLIASTTIIIIPDVSFRQGIQVPVSMLHWGD